MTPLKILAWAGDIYGSGHYRLRLPLQELAKLGHQARVLNDITPEDLVGIDLLIGQRICTPDQSHIWQTLAAHPARDFAMVHEIDDNLWDVNPDNPDYGHFRQPIITHILSQASACADAVTVTTDRLAEIAGKHNKNVYVLPNCFDERYLSLQRPRAEGVTLGYAGGLSHVADFRAASREIAGFLRKNPQVDTHFLGGNYGAMVGRPQTRFTGWNADMDSYLKCLDFDFGIAPLEYHEFNRSKSDVKFLEYSSLGIPAVVADFGPYSASVQHGVTGFLARYPHEWPKYLRQLANDAELRTAMGAAAREWAATRTIQANAWRWAEAYQQTVRGESAAA